MKAFRLFAVLIGLVAGPLHAELPAPARMGCGIMTFDTVPGLARVAKEIARQAAMIGYLNAFTMYTVTSALAVAFALMVRRRKM